MNVTEVETPALLLHLDVVERNVTRMAERARRLGVRLRPHARTHKCVELARLQARRGAEGPPTAPDHPPRRAGGPGGLGGGPGPPGAGGRRWGQGGAGASPARRGPPTPHPP